MRSLNWFGPGEALGSRDIDLAESRLGVKFPADYMEMVSAHAGADNPDESEFEYMDDGELCVGNFGVLLSLRGYQSASVFRVLDTLGEQLPSRVVPVVGTGSGDFVCLDYRESEFPSVVYFAHENSQGSDVILLARSFSEFVDSLKAPDDL